MLKHDRSLWVSITVIPTRPIRSLQLNILRLQDLFLPNPLPFNVNPTILHWTAKRANGVIKFNLHNNIHTSLGAAVSLIFTYPGFTWLIRPGCGPDDRIYWVFAQLVTIVHNSLSDTPSSSSDWTCHWNYSDFQLKSSVLRYTPSILMTVPFYNTSARTPRKTPFSGVKNLFIGPLRSNGFLIVESVTSGICLPSRCLDMSM